MSAEQLGLPLQKPTEARDSETASIYSDLDLLARARDAAIPGGHLHSMLRELIHDIAGPNDNYLLEGKWIAVRKVTGQQIGEQKELDI